MKTPPDLQFHPIAEHHRFNSFDCGDRTVNQWVRNKAWDANARHYSRCHVAENEDGEMLAIYALEVHGEPTRKTGGNVKSQVQRYNDTFPVLQLAWLGVHKDCQRGTELRYGEQAMVSVIMTSAEIFERTGGAGLHVEAASDKAAEFFRFWQFMPYRPDDERRLIMPIQLVFEIRDRLTSST